MEYTIEKKLLDMVPYNPVQGEFRIRLDANESPFTLPEEVLDRFSKVLKNIEFNRYPDPYSVDLCAKYAAVNNIHSDCLVAGNGSDELINLIIQTFLKDGDKVLGFSLDFSMYKFYTNLRRCRMVTFENKTDCPISEDDFISVINKEKPQIVIFSNPCNPTGQIISKENVVKICTSCLPSTLVIMDEAYMDFANESILDVVSKMSNVIVLRTMSKAFAAAGIRLGFAISNSKIIEILKKTKAPYNVNAVTQTLGLTLLEYTHEFQECIKWILRMRNSLYENLIKYKSVLTPFLSSANFVLIRTDKAKAIYEGMLKEGIVIRYFGNDLLRITAGSEYEQEQLFLALDKIIEDMR